MKGYLGLVSEYAKVHKKKNRLTIICIAISVMLVTAIFGMADMSLKAQKRGSHTAVWKLAYDHFQYPFRNSGRYQQPKRRVCFRLFGYGFQHNLSGKRIDYPKQQRGTCETNEFISYRGTLPCFGNGSIVRQAGLGAIRAVYWRYD